MSTVVPYFGEAGDGPSVVCLHANASSSSKWRGLMEMLAADYHAIALIAALRHRGRIKALAVHESTLFSLVDAKSPAPNGADGIRNAVAHTAAALEAGDTDSAARHFIDFWKGAAWRGA
jgi:pimeloyl-ACP methyl ester carboxylesterase